MIRLIVTTSDCGAAANISGAVCETVSKSFDIEHPELEKLLARQPERDTYISRMLTYEVRPPARRHEMTRLNTLPRIVCLCGSTRFYEYFQRANYEETMAGRIVLSVGFYPHAQKEVHHSEDVGCTPEQKIKLDELHKRKIDLADEVLVLNVGGYIGSSTRSEIEHAEKTGKPIRYLESAQHGDTK